MTDAEALFLCLSSVCHHTILRSDRPLDARLMDEEIVNEFLVESRELLERVDRDLVALEREPQSRPLIASIFRSMHTIRGRGVCLGFSQLAWLAHTAENVLGRLRDGELIVDAAIIGALLETADALRARLDEI